MDKRRWRKAYREDTGQTHKMAYQKIITSVGEKHEGSRSVKRTFTGPYMEYDADYCVKYSSIIYFHYCPI